MKTKTRDKQILLLEDAWHAYGQDKQLIGISELSAGVSNNRVFRMNFDDQSSLIAKSSSYGNYKQFIDDHERIELWAKLLKDSRFDKFLAHTLLKENHVFSYFKDKKWVIFYEEKPITASLPKILGLAQVELFAREMAAFHKECLNIIENFPQLTKSVITDMLDLNEELTERKQPYNLTEDERSYLLHQTTTFLERMHTLGYHQKTRIPLLVDWNIGNFSIESKGESFSFQSRWDYDWFRMEPAVFDFYFCSRIVSHEGDRDDFSYWPHGFFEPRFKHFLISYHKVNPLVAEDIFFLKEVYRFFILNYVVKDGIKFFRRKYFKRLLKESINFYLPEVDAFDFMGLYNELKHILH